MPTPHPAGEAPAAHPRGLTPRHVQHLPRSARTSLHCLTRSRIWVSLLAGCLTGCAGITGYKGFGVYLLSHLLVRGRGVWRGSLTCARQRPPGLGGW